MTRTIFASSYLLLLIAGFVLWFASNFERVAILSLPKLIQHMMHFRSTRIALFAVWWWLGWHFLWAKI